MNYPVGTLAVIAIGNVENIKALKVTERRWTFAEAPDLGLNKTAEVERNVQVQRVLKKADEVIVPSRRPYDVDNMNAAQLEAALEEILGANEGDQGDYYSDYSGPNGFYHKLAGTFNLGYSEKTDEEPKYTESEVGGKVVLTIPELGNFTAVDKITEFMAESGDADSNIVFEFNNRFFRKQGYLDSYEGGYWDGRLEQVKPVEKTITVWERA